ncbi:MAG: phosphomannomutase/phosphoglucomutase [bacterium]
MGNIFKAYDIRGAYPDELDESAAWKIGAALVKLLKAKSVVIGQDMRPSSSSLARAFAEGAISSGASVSDIGMATTPMLYYAIIEGNFDAGAMVTASHLPPGSNGLKLSREKAIPLSGAQGLPALERMVKEEWPEQPPIGASGGAPCTAPGSAALPAPETAPSGAARGSYRTISLMDTYIDTLAGFVHHPKPLKVVVDAGNGTAGPEVFALFEKIPDWTLIPLYTVPDGISPHHVANPLILSTLRDLQAAVIKEEADLGVAFDGDCDRCGFIDENGVKIPEDLVTALIAEFFLTREPGSTILYDLRSSKTVPGTITRLGGKAVRCRVGHAFIKARMRQENALFAGELSGHYYYRDTGFTDNAMYTMIQMLNYLALKNMPLSRIVLPLKKYSSTGEINLQVKDKDAIWAALETTYKDGQKDYLDGLTVEYKSWWFNIRASNTEPVMRLNLEAQELNTMEEKRDEVFKVIKKADPSLVLMA